ncbi:uncharacterized protein LOC112501455 [Cynara cardunculus var. scolymus]|uniref:uncharacterized protein LOC112501455 n=1 Tax=Cynara cardunculus var. scolymus TaxID=59895 RepID=UPI000D6272F0|nr:uncharacterized protein LOC112501455 [Cynara cardunculus var. scolymus]
MSNSICYLEAGEKQFVGPEIVLETMDKVKGIREHLKAAQDCQKIYADKKRQPAEFQVGEWVMLKVPHGRCLAKEKSVIPLSEFHMDGNNRCMEEPYAILERNSKKLHHKEVIMVKVNRNTIKVRPLLGEAEDDMRKRYPH